jgi:bacterioferritin
MDVQQAVTALNKALSLEYAGLIRYLQHGFLVQDFFREVYAQYFKENSDSCHNHARQLGNMITGLGAVPTVEPAPIRQATDLAEMLQQDLEQEREALQAYFEAINIVEDNPALRTMLELMAEDEQRSVWHLEKILKQKDFRLTRKEIRLQQAG